MTESLRKTAPKIARLRFRRSLPPPPQYPIRGEITPFRLIKPKPKPSHKAPTIPHISVDGSVQGNGICVARLVITYDPVDPNTFRPAYSPLSGTGTIKSVTNKLTGTTYTQTFLIDISQPGVISTWIASDDRRDILFIQFHDQNGDLWGVYIPSPLTEEDLERDCPTCLDRYRATLRQRRR